MDIISQKPIQDMSSGDILLMVIHFMIHILLTIPKAIEGAIKEAWEMWR